MRWKTKLNQLILLGQIQSRPRRRQKLTNQSQPVVAPIEEEITAYLHQPMLQESEALDFEPLNYWSSNEVKYSLLSSLAEYLLTILAFSAPAERVFSAAGISTSGRRNRLDKHNLEREVLLKKNKFVLM